MVSVVAIYTVERFVRMLEEFLLLSEEWWEKLTWLQLEQKRVWVSFANSPEVVITVMFEEVMYWDVKRKKEWIVLVDGNRT